VVPVFALRTGIRRYELRVMERFDPRTPGDSEAALTATVRAYERLVREVPAQWLMFEDVWAETAAAGMADGPPVTHGGEPESASQLTADERGSGTRPHPRPGRRRSGR
jgi:hypothetical protein